MLTSLRLTDFKSFRDQTIPLAPLTVLVGANASGKSNLFDAVRFLQGIGLNLTVSEILLGRREGGREVWPGLRGGVAEAARIGCDHFGLESVWDLTRHLETNEWRDSPLGTLAEHRITCRTTSAPAIVREGVSFRDTGICLFDTENGAFWGNSNLTEGVGWPGDDARTTHRPGEYGSAMSLLRALVFTPIKGLPQSIRDRCDLIVESMRESMFLDVSPSAMREYQPREAGALGDQGENISPVLWRLCQDEDRKSNLIDWLSELCAPAITDIRFDETRQGEIRFELIEAGGVAISARSLSEGTLRFLGLVVALLTVRRETAPMPLLLIEEIENGLHPTRLHLLVELLEQVTSAGQVQVLATTHSPLVLQHLSDEALGNAVVLGRLPEEEGSVARRLGDLKNFDEVAGRRGVDHLFATGWLERAL